MFSDERSEAISDETLWLRVTSDASIRKGERREWTRICEFVSSTDRNEDLSGMLCFKVLYLSHIRPKGRSNEKSRCLFMQLYEVYVKLFVVCDVVRMATGRTVCV